MDRQRFVAVVEEDCTGCNTCVDYCLVDCIEPAPPNSDPRSRVLISIREDECIGCFVCAKVCEELAVNAIRLVPAAEAGRILNDAASLFCTVSPPLVEIAAVKENNLTAEISGTASGAVTNYKHWPIYFVTAPNLVASRSSSRDLPPTPHRLDQVESVSEQPHS